jgi:hypothetical protein
MATTETTLFPPPLRESKLSEPEQRYLASLQRLLPLRIGDTSGGPYAEALPPAGVNTTTGQSNQNQELIYKKMSPDANVWTITGGAEGSQTISVQYGAIRFKSDGTNWWVVGVLP